MFKYKDWANPSEVDESKTVELERSELCQMLRALGDPTRLAIFDLLMEGVQCNCEIAEQLGLSLSLVSHHLRKLQRVGLVESERDRDDARWIYYMVNQQALAVFGRGLQRLLDPKRIQPRAPSCGPKSCDARRC